MFTATKTRKTATPPAVSAAPAHGFVYQRLPEMRLAALKAEEGNGVHLGDLQDAVQTAQGALLSAETAEALGKPADVASARAAFQAARDAVATYRPASPALKAERRNVSALIEKL